MKFFTTLFTLFILLFSVDAVAQKVDLSSAETLLGQKVTATITIAHDPDEKTEFIEPFSLPNGMEIKSKTVTPFKGGSILAIEILPWATGDITVPGIGIKVLNPDGSNKLITSDSFSFTVKSLVGESDPLPEPKPIKKQTQIEPDWVQIIWPEILLLLIPALLYLLYRRFKPKLKSKKNISPPPIPERPEIIALRKIDHLAKKKLLNAGKIKPHFYELSQIVREYLEKRCALPALEMTTFELAQEKEIPADCITLLQMCDQSKYRKKNESAGDDGTESARKIVNSFRIGTREE